MSINLTTQVLSITNLSQPEKHILMVLCFLSNQYNEVYRSINKLSSDCSCSVKTIERTLKKFRDTGYLIYTGKMAPKSKNIPVYRINLNHGLTGGDKTLTTDFQSFNHGLSGNLTTDSEGIRIDNINKDNIKDIRIFFSSLPPKDQTIYLTKYNEYARRIDADIFLKVIDAEYKKLYFEDWFMLNKSAC